MKIFGRDPQWLLSLFAAVVIGISTFLLPLTDAQQSVLNGVAVALVGVIVGFSTHDGQLALIVGLFKALISLGLGFGLKLSPEQQAAIMTLVMAVGSGFLRTQLAAKVPPPPEVLPQVRFDGSAGASMR
jgi:hypothetical protein